MMMAASSFCSAGAVRLTPGFGIVVARDGRQLHIRFDPEARNVPVQLHGQSLICRRMVKTVYAPQSRAPLAEEWQANGAAVVLPALDRSGLYVATLLWEDAERPVKVDDRVELGRLAPEAAKPVILALRVVSQRAPAQPAAAPATGPGPAAAPGETLWVIPDIFCPTGEAPKGEWSTDAGEFVAAGGASLGRSLQGAGPVRWRAPVAGTGAAPDAAPPAAAKATIRLKVSAPCRPLATEEAVTVRIEEPTGAYRRVQLVPIRIQPPGARRLGPVFAEASLLAAGPLGGVFILDAPGHRLVHWGHGGPSVVELGDAPVTALEALADGVCFAQGDALMAWSPVSDKPQQVAKLPPLKRLVGLRTGAAGDLYALDSGEAPAVHVLQTGQAGPWQRAPLGLTGDSPWLARFALDPLSNDAFVFDARDRVVRQWRAWRGTDYAPVEVAIPVGAATDRYGAPIELLPRPDGDHTTDLPLRLVFKSGALTERWNYEAPRAAGASATWEPVVGKAPRELGDMRFTAARAAALPDGDLALAGQATVGDAAGPAVAQVSPKGEFRRMLPLPEMPPRFIAAAPDGQRYALLVGRTQRLVVLDPDGWVARDLGAIEAIRPITRVRADRAAPELVYVVGEKGKRVSAFRLNVANPSAHLELSAAGLPGVRIPDHEALDIATSPEFLAVLDRRGKVLLFANEKPPRFITLLDSELSRPAAIALVASTHDAAGGRQPYLCVLPSGREAAAGVHVWQVRTAGGGKPTVTKVGVAPAALSAPVTLDSAFPDRPWMLYVLDRGGTQVRALDLPALLEKGATPSAAPAIDKVPVADGAADMAVGPGQIVHIADTEGEAIHSYARTR